MTPIFAIVNYLGSKIVTQGVHFLQISASSLKKSAVSIAESTS